MKYRFFAVILMALMLLSGAALAEDAIPQVEMELSQVAFDGPQEVAVTIRITNTNGSDMPGPCALYAPDGRQIVAFGTPTLAAGESAEWTGVWAVTEEQLAQERIAFAMMYTVQDASGALLGKTAAFYSPISRTAAQPELTLTVTADKPELAAFPGVVTFTITVANTGDADADMVDVYASDMKLYRFDRIPAGETRSFRRQVLVTSAGSYAFEAHADGETQQRHAVSCIVPIAATEAPEAPAEEAMSGVPEAAPTEEQLTPVWTLMLYLTALLSL